MRPPARAPLCGAQARYGAGMVLPSLRARPARPAGMPRRRAGCGAPLCNHAAGLVVVRSAAARALAACGPRFLGGARDGSWPGAR